MSITGPEYEYAEGKKNLVVRPVGVGRKCHRAGPEKSECQNWRCASDLVWKGRGALKSGRERKVKGGGTVDDRGKGKASGRRTCTERGKKTSVPAKTVGPNGPHQIYGERVLGQTYPTVCPGFDTSGRVLL